MLAPVMRDRSVPVSACCAKILCGCILSASFSAGTQTIDRVCFQTRINFEHHNQWLEAEAISVALSHLHLLLMSQS